MSSETNEIKSSTEKKSIRHPNSAAMYYWFWMFLKFIGIKTGCNKYFCGVYDVFLNVFITIAYPLHLTIGLFLHPTFADVFKNLSINITCLACSVKHYILRSKLQEITNIQEKLNQLDQSIVDKDEKLYINDILHVQVIRTVKLFVYGAACADVSAIISVLLSNERRLMYPAWLPFDISSSALNYWLALCYQFYGVTIQIIQNLANDTFTPMSLCIIAGHFRILRMRISKIGYNTQKTETEHRKELIACIRYHRILVEILKILQNAVYFGQLVQFLCSGLLICVTLVFLLYYVDTFFGYVYYTIFLFCMGLEIFPCCYFGSLLEQELQSLPYAVFNSNWLMANVKYRKEFIMFTQLTLRDIKLTAGGLIGINMNAFFGTCRMAYSMFAVILRTK